MKRLNETYKRLLLREDDENQLFDIPEKPLPNPNLYPGLRDKIPPVPDQFPIDPNRPNLIPPSWIKDIYTVDPNFEGWSPWDGTGNPPKNWPYITDPNGIHPPIPLPPGRPHDYPSWAVWPPPPGSPWYKPFKDAQDIIGQGLPPEWPSWIENTEDLFKWLNKRTGWFGVSIYSQQRAEQIAMAILYLIQFFRPSPGFGRPIQTTTTELDASTLPDDMLKPLLTGEESPDFPKPINWPQDKPWPPVPGNIPPGWYPNEYGDWELHYPAHFPPSGAIKWTQYPPPAHWVWYPQSPGQVPMVWDPFDGWQFDPNYDPYPPPSYSPIDPADVPDIPYRPWPGSPTGGW